MELRGDIVIVSQSCWYGGVSLLLEGVVVC